MSIIIYTQELKNALRLASCLGGIAYGGKYIKEAALAEKEDEIFQEMKLKHHFMTTIGSSTATFIWGEGLVVPYKPADYDGYNFEDGFDVAEVEFKVKPGCEEQTEVIKGIFGQKEEYTEVYDASIGTKGHTEFACIYKAVDSKIPVRRIEITSFEKDDIEFAFNNPVPFAETFKSSLRDNAYIHTYYLANTNLPLILEKALPTPYPKTKELPVLEEIIKKQKEINKAEAENYYMLGLQATTSKGDKFILGCKTAKFKTKAEAYAFADTIPGETEIYVEEAVDETYSKGPHSADSIEKEAETLYKYPKKKTRIILNSLHAEGFITSANTKSRKFGEGSEGDIERLIKNLSKTKAFNEILGKAESFRPPEQYFAEDRRSGILTTKKTPDDSFRDMEKRNVYYLICKELVKTVLGPKIVKKRKAYVKFNDFTFSNTGLEVLDKGHSTLEEKTQHRNNVPSYLTTGNVVTLNFMVDSKNKSLPSHKKESEITHQFTDDKSLLKFRPDEIRSTIESMIIRGLLIRKGDSLIPTDHCMVVMDFLSKFDGLIESSLAWEGSLHEIDMETTSAETAESIAMNLRLAVQQSIRKWHREANELAGKKTEMACPCCKDPIYSNSKGLWCRKCGYEVSREFMGRIITDKEFLPLMKLGSTQMLKGFSIDEGPDTMGRVYLDENKELQFTLDSQNSCPCCNTKFRVVNDIYVCPECQYELKRTVLNHQFTVKEILRLLSAKRTNLIENLIDENGEVFNGVLYLDAEDGHKVKCIKVTA